MLVEPKCSERGCKHFLGVKNATDDEVNDIVICEAFPNGIPWNTACSPRFSKKWAAKIVTPQFSISSAAQQPRPACLSEHDYYLAQHQLHNSCLHYDSTDPKLCLARNYDH